jgi:hypothetical protein
MAPQWTKLLPQELLRHTALRADAYLRMADATHWVHHGGKPSGRQVWPVAVQSKLPPSGLHIAGLKVGAAYRHSLFFTARVSTAALNALLTHEQVVRVQFAQPLVPQRPNNNWRTPWAAGSTPAVSSAGKTSLPSSLLLGVIDTACPFAHADLRRPDGEQTRVVALWDMDATRGSGGPPPPGSMGYGQEFGETLLNQLMMRAKDSQGRINEHACYLKAGMDQVMSVQSHGSHALGLLAGRFRISSDPRKGLGPGKDAGLRALQQNAESAGADIAFVQFPRKLMAAAFPSAVQYHALDALRYLLELGKQRKVKKLVVSFAWQSWLGSHDPNSWLAQAVASLVAEATTAGIEMTLFFAAGNGGIYDVHAALPDKEKEHALTWHLPPDNQQLSHVEIWLPKGADHDRVDIALEITPPGLPPLPPVRWGDALAWPSAQQPALCVVADTSGVLGGPDSDVVVLRLSPSKVFDRGLTAARHGEWTLRLTSTAPLVNAHVYLGNAIESMGAPRRGRQSEFTRRTDQPIKQDRYGSLNHYAATHVVWAVTASAATDNLYDPKGCASSRRKLGVQAFEPGQAAPYAGYGPGRDGARTGPDFAVTVEWGLYHQGTLGIGNRSASLFRMWGTSVAVPLGARYFADDRRAAKVSTKVDLRTLGHVVFEP